MLSHSKRRLASLLAPKEHVKIHIPDKPSTPHPYSSMQASFIQPSDPSSNILLLALKQSRYSYLNFLFHPAPIRPSALIDNSNFSISYLGTADLGTGPHIFYDTAFYRLDLAASTPSSPNHSPTLDMATRKTRPQIVFEFRENGEKAFILPPCLIQVITTNAPYEITAAFYVPSIDESRQKESVTGPQQGLIVKLSRLSQQLVDALINQVRNPHQLVDEMIEKSRTLPILKKVALDFNARLELPAPPPKPTLSLSNGLPKRGGAGGSQPATPNAPTNTPGGAKSCLNCGTTTTVVWRKGPLGNSTLCNACGVKWHSQKKKAAGSRTSNGSRKRGRSGARKKVKEEVMEDVEGSIAMKEADGAEEEETEDVYEDEQIDFDDDEELDVRK